MPSTSTSLARTMLHGLRTSCCGVCSLHHACREAVSENNAVQSKYQNNEVDQFYFQDIDQIKGKKKKSIQNENESDPVEKKNLHEKKHLHEKQNLHENRYASEEQNIAEHSQKLEHLLELSLGAMLIVSEHDGSIEVLYREPHEGSGERDDYFHFGENCEKCEHMQVMSVKSPKILLLGEQEIWKRSSTSATRTDGQSD